MKGSYRMNGAQALIGSAISQGIEICFANAGTTELPIVTAMDKAAGFKAVLGLFEGVCTGAADGYGRLSGKPAMNLLHLGPGFANGIANLHNARRAGTPVFNVIGEHATWHRDSDPPLAMDIEGLSATVSSWTRTNRSPSDLPLDVANAVSIASEGRIASLIVPHDHQLAPCRGGRPKPIERCFDPLDESEVKKAAQLFMRHDRTAMLLGSRALRKEGLVYAAEIRDLTGCNLLAETFPGSIERGAGLPDIGRIPYFPEQAVSRLSGYEGILLAGAREPMAFFGYPGGVSRILREDQAKAFLGTGRQDVLEAMGLLIDILKSSKKKRQRERKADALRRPAMPDGDLDPVKVCQTLAALQPEGAIMVEEGLTTSMGYYSLTAGLPPHTILSISGGAIGYGMPCATGAALACSDRPVISFQADGSAMYTVQALWTQAREGLNITTLLCSNREYKILKMELERAGIKNPGIKACALTDLTGPNIDWVKIAGGFGVPAVSVTTAQELARALRRGLVEPGPFLIEMIL
jgi:acetolactate synthase-1/2/3 large subunit